MPKCIKGRKEVKYSPQEVYSEILPWKLSSPVLLTQLANIYPYIPSSTGCIWAHIVPVELGLHCILFRTRPCICIQICKKNSNILPRNPFNIFCRLKIAPRAPTTAPPTPQFAPQQTGCPPMTVLSPALASMLMHGRMMGIYLMRPVPQVGQKIIYLYMKWLLPFYGCNYFSERKEDKQELLLLLNEYKIYKKNYANNIKFDPSVKTLRKYFLLNKSNLDFL